MNQVYQVKKYKKELKKEAEEQAERRAYKEAKNAKSKLWKGPKRQLMVKFKQ